MERVFATAMLPGLNRLRREAGLDELTSPHTMLERPDAVIAAHGRGPGGRREGRCREPGWRLRRRRRDAARTPA